MKKPRRRGGFWLVLTGLAHKKARDTGLSLITDGRVPLERVPREKWLLKPVVGYFLHRQNGGQNVSCLACQTTRLRYSGGTQNPARAAADIE